jgi:hypothetical protein
MKATACFQARKKIFHGFKVEKKISIKTH